MRDPFVFDSRSEFCKSPYGAAPCGGRVTFHVRPLYAEGYSRCVLVAWREFSNSADTLEEEMLEKVNELGIGPQGFGGRTTAIGLNIETMPTHIAGMPCAININCHVTRHKTEVI